MATRHLALALATLLLVLLAARVVPRGHIIFPVAPRAADGWRTELWVQWVTAARGNEFIITRDNWRYCWPKCVLVKTRPPLTPPTGLEIAP